ncbi:MAG: hypothetical protein WCT14_15850 [Treponemataceae bacterium]
MSLFCLFFVPAFYVFRRDSLSEEKSAFPEPGVISGFILGLIAAFIRFSWGELFSLRGYGFAAFAVQLIDGAPYDALLPIACYAFLRRFGRPRRRFDETEAVNFSLAWLVPICALRSIYWSSVPDPVRLVIIPILFVSLAVSFPHWIRKALDEYGLSQAIAIIVVVLSPLTVAGVSWAFFTHRPIFGLVFFCAACAVSIPPMVPLFKSIR